MQKSEQLAEKNFSKVQTQSTYFFSLLKSIKSDPDLELLQELLPKSQKNIENWIISSDLEFSPQLGQVQLQNFYEELASVPEPQNLEWLRRKDKWDDSVLPQKPTTIIIDPVVNLAMRKLNQQKEKEAVELVERNKEDWKRTLASIKKRRKEEKKLKLEKKKPPKLQTKEQLNLKKENKKLLST